MRSHRRESLEARLEVPLGNPSGTASAIPRPLIDVGRPRLTLTPPQLLAHN
jgi:hypothetical protein